VLPRSASWAGVKVFSATMPENLKQMLLTVCVPYAVRIMSTLDEQADAPNADERLRRIELVTDAALAHLSVEDLLAELLDRVQALLDVDTVAVLLLDASAEQLVATAAKGIEAEVRQGVRIPLGKGFAGRVAAEKIPVILPQIDHTTVLNPILWDRGIRSLLGVPLLSSGRVVGVLHVGTLGSRQFTDADVRLLEIVADRVASAIQARQVETERAATGMLQRSLLPARLPGITGLEMTARYVPAERGGLGGDWYDVFVLPSGGVCIVVGDVVGRGFAAAEEMGRLRSTLRAHALFSSDPAEALTRLNKQVQHFDRPRMLATAQLAILEPSFERLHLSSAGHLPPVLAVPDQRADIVAVSNDPPVGVSGVLPRRSTTINVPAGASLCFYTDGLVERRKASLDVGLKRLCEAVVAGPVETVCTSIMGQLVGDDPPGDDIAVLLLRRQLITEINPLELVFPARARSLKDIRDAMRPWLSAVGAGTRTIADLLIAVGEACTNVVKHAYGPEGGFVTVRLELQLPDVVATIADAGRWQLPREGSRRRGTMIMRRCSDDVRISRGSPGTTVVIRRRLAEEATR
jgi:anti-sigma regulatory factor (Ser/Thr protein kinase)/putative methionine-R-sulfoxide reductase with GAF domain